MELNHWVFGKELFRNGAIFGADNSSSRHPDKGKVSKLLDEWPANNIDVNVGEAEKQLSINCIRKRQNFVEFTLQCW